MTPSADHEMYAESDGSITHVFAEGAEPTDLVRPDHIITEFEVGLMFVESDAALILTLGLHGEDEPAVVVIDPELARHLAEGISTALGRI